ncbi:MAG: MFS transporter [Candidatus Krumholzibacteria bacterium]|nr:MFS transporter [Candidatus Krumholzibacteria bacterium]
MKTWGLAFAFRALRARNYRLFFSGQSISLIGTWMQQIAMIWLVYRLTHSALLLGVVGFAGQIPTFLFTPFTGVLADRWNRHRTIIVTQTLALLQATTLAILVLTDTAQVWHLIALAVVLGTINALDMPVRQSFIIQMIERKEDLANAIALNSAMVTATRLLGPSIAGVLIGAFGEGICFLVNAISYVAVIAALLAMRVAPPPARPANGRMIDGLKEGFAYVAGFAPVRDILLLLAFISVMGMPYYILMPVFAKDVLGGGAHTLGFLMGASGLGALVGTIYLATRKNIRGFGGIITAAATVFGAGLIAFSLSRVVWLSMVLVFVAGLGMMVQMACSNTIIQTIVDGGFCVAGGILFAGRLKAIRQVLHPIYRKMGIMPDIPT